VKVVKEITATLAKVDTLRSDIRTWTTEFALQSSSVLDTDTKHHDTILCSAQLKLEFLVSLLITYVASSAALSPLSHHLNLPILHQQCYSTIHSLSHEILSRIPPALGDPIPNSSLAENPESGGGCWVDVVQLLFPIMVVCRIPAVAEEQRYKATRILQRLGTKMGIRFAMDYVSNYKTIMLKPLKPTICY
jgi:hypothetical protein